MPSFDLVHSIVVKEIMDHPEVWVCETKDYRKVVERLRQIEVPAMNLIHGSVIERLGRIPRSSERDESGNPYYVTLDDVVSNWEPHDDMTDFEIDFLSHRWSFPREGLPDDELNSKAEIVVRLSNYTKSLYKKDCYWWIDYTCADQENCAGHIASLPLYIAASSIRSVYIPGGDYDNRGWIRVERALSAALCSPRAWKFIPYSCYDEDVPKEEWWTIEDPAEGESTNPLDQHYLVTLSRLATEIWPIAHANNWYSTGNKYAEWGYEGELVYGQTKIFTWLMNKYVGRR